MLVFARACVSMRMLARGDRARARAGQQFLSGVAGPAMRALLRRQGSRVPPPCGTSTAPWRPDKDGVKQVFFRRRRSPRVGRANCYHSSSVRSGRVYRAAAAGRSGASGRCRVACRACVRLGTCTPRDGRAGRARERLTRLSPAHMCSSFWRRARRPSLSSTTYFMTE